MYSLRTKIKQLFIAGFSGTSIKNNEIFINLLKDGLGGVIFFTQNIESPEQVCKCIGKIKDNALIAPFISIDQEGGRVERTENIHGGKKYLSAKDAAQKALHENVAKGGFEASGSATMSVGQKLNKENDKTETSRTRRFISYEDKNRRAALADKVENGKKVVMKRNRKK